MKRLILWMLLLVLVACGASGGEETAVDTTTNNNPTENTETDTTQPEETTDSEETEEEPADEEPVQEPATEEEPANEAVANGKPAITPALSAEEANTVRTGDYVKGATNPTVTIIEYGDLQCPACAGFAPVIRQMVEDYPDDVQVIFRHFPLNSIHPLAQKAAEANEAAGAQGAFWEFHDNLYDRQSEWTNLSEEEAIAYFVAIAEELELDTATFEQEINDGIYSAYVTSLGEEAIQIGATGTPTVIMNGQLMGARQMPPTYFWWQGLIGNEILAKKYPTLPEQTIDTSKTYFARVTMANGTEFVIELYDESAPLTVNSFIYLAEDGFFDGVSFHRVLPGFVAQTGDPTGTGIGGPGYSIPNEIDPSLSHADAGMVAMANSGPDTNGSQWYITYGDVSQLDGGYTIFGKVVEGFENVEAITPRDPSQNPELPEGDLIESIVIEVEE